MSYRVRFYKENGHWPNSLELLGYKLKSLYDEGVISWEEVSDILMKRINPGSNP